MSTIQFIVIIVGIVLILSIFVASNIYWYKRGIKYGYKQAHFNKIKKSRSKPDTYNAVHYNPHRINLQ